MRIQRALWHAFTSAADVTFKKHGQVLVWRENQVNNCIGKWVGLQVVDSGEPGKEQVYVCNTKVGPARSFNMAQVKIYLKPDAAAHTHVLNVASDLHCLSHASDTLMTEVLEPDDRHAKSAKMKQAIKDEVQGMMRRSNFNVVKKRRVPCDANVLPCKYILAIKFDKTGNERYKARFVIGGHRDRRKAFLVHTSQAI